VKGHQKLTTTLKLKENVYPYIYFVFLIFVSKVFNFSIFIYEKKKSPLYMQPTNRP